MDSFIIEQNVRSWEIVDVSLVTGRHPEFDKWFEKAEYIGLKLGDEE